MKKTYFFVSLVICIFLMVSCTDNSENIQERIDLENGTKLIDKDKVESPTTKG